MLWGLVERTLLAKGRFTMSHTGYSGLSMVLSLQQLRSLLWLRFDPCPMNFHMLWVQQKTNKQTNKKNILIVVAQ